MLPLNGALPLIVCLLISASLVRLILSPEAPASAAVTQKNGPCPSARKLILPKRTGRKEAPPLNPQRGTECSANLTLQFAICILPSADTPPAASLFEKHFPLGSASSTWEAVPQSTIACPPPTYVNLLHPLPTQKIKKGKSHPAPAPLCVFAPSASLRQKRKTLPTSSLGHGQRPHRAPPIRNPRSAIRNLLPAAIRSPLSAVRPFPLSLISHLSSLIACVVLWTLDPK